MWKRKLRKAEESISEAKVALLKSGITNEQMEHLERFVFASIALIQYGMLKVAGDNKN